MSKKIIIAVFAILIIGYGVFKWQTSSYEQQAEPETNIESTNAFANVKIPAEFSDDAIIGKQIFETKCASCHGQNAAGKKGLAPPLVHIIYEPAHHGDESFQRAVALGVISHHWSFGNMPPVVGLSRADVEKIIAYIRELQRENGIY